MIRRPRDDQVASEVNCLAQEVNSAAARTRLICSANGSAGGDGLFLLRGRLRERICLWEALP